MNYSDVNNYLEKNQHSWLVTGAAGFIGSHLSEKLISKNQKVLAFDNLSTGSMDNIHALTELSKKYPSSQFEFIKADLQNIEACKNALKNIDFVLHQAALGSVPRSIENPIQTHKSNDSGTLNLLVAAKDNPIKKFIFASSSSVYGDSPHSPKVEDQIGKPLSPYAIGKLTIELYAKNFYELYNLPTIGLRYFNVFGPRQNPNGPYAAVIPSFVKSIKLNQPVKINGDGSTSRDFGFIENTIQANLLAALSKNKDCLGEVFNVTCGEKTTINELYELIKSHIQAHHKNLNVLDPIYQDFRPGDIKHSLADISKIKKMLNYVPTHFLSDGLPSAVDWYLSTEF